MTRPCFLTASSFALLLLSFIPSAAAPSGRSVPLIENQAQYISRCRAETIAQYPNAQAQADSICRTNWDLILAAGPMADAILSAAPAPGMPFTPASARAQLTSVKWAARAVQGRVASGTLGDVEIGLTQNPARLTLDWFRAGEPIPFNLQEALHVRGATLALIACQSFGSSEGTRVYRVSANGKAAFALTVVTLEAAVASQSSTYGARVDFSGAMPSLAALRKDGSEWSAKCPQ